MPATYAHYRFGAQMLNRMPGDVRRTAKRHRHLFDMGLHGPDLFFFYRPVCSTQISKLGSKFHRQTGREFFSRVCRNLRLDPSEEGKAYLYGILCHYALDSHCHPIVNEKSREGMLNHSRIEAEFERFLMVRDGIRPPAQMRLTKHMVLTEQECAAVSRFYPGTQPKHIRESVKEMAAICKLLELPEGIVRSMVIRTIGAGSKTFRHMVVQPEPDPLCEELNLPLLEQYHEAGKVFPAMLLQLLANLTYNAPFGELYDPIFG